MTVDSEANVYVTGASQGTGSVDFATIKYDMSGNEMWVARYDGPGGSNDQPAPPTGGTVGASFGNYLFSNQGIIVTTEVLNVRDGPGEEYPIVVGVESGETLTVLGANAEVAAELSAVELDRLLDPAHYLGLAQSWVARAVAEHRATHR